ncbi:hypothetical protein Q5424_07250 [Conexibacter sp. JD483]|uniref:hypothetical protein n=1 Tax=unclassified Conexibacter TaxID=2627773 RepID=UPI00271BF455|nr:MULTISPECIES: hypothetical protein [unclassified Conexibacter]MDO8187159.1 hypothetical protein [Conexibacter sp. CPCC 205706]MDO8200335.1 hypothetical protein [Conexibacter sp. CPCC 205762]MDR9368869.1 hypothetical protein [Conexibacter sp. JD483]
MAGVVHIPWYATLFRNDRFAEALQDVAPIAIRYGASEVQIHQSRDDRYRFDHMCWFDSRAAWERFWESDEMIRFRARYSGWYQVPVLYVWQDVIARIEVEPQAETAAAPAPAASEEAAA